MGSQLPLCLLVLVAISPHHNARAKYCLPKILEGSVNLTMDSPSNRADFTDNETGPNLNNNLLCSTWGNFHYKTFDRDVFYFPGTCNYLLSSNCKSNIESFNIQLRRTIIDGIPTISYITIVINGEFFIITKDSIRMNGNLIQLPYRSSWIEIKSKNNYVKVVATLGFTLTWNLEDNIHLELDAAYTNMTCGLCGDFNGVPLYDEFFSNGVQLSSYEYAILQKVEGPTDQCDEELGPFQDDPCVDDGNVCRTIFNSVPFSECQALVGTLPYIKTCIEDLCRCSSSDELSAFCFCRNVAEYSRQCADAGGEPLNWRTPEMCPRTCPPEMEYKECGPWTVDSCSSRGVSLFHQEHCLDGCFCLEGTVLDDISNIGCIAADQCSCTSNGLIYPPGETFTNPCSNCQCTKGQWTCVPRPCPGFCSIEGGSHITTYDEVTYNFHGDCDYVLSQQCENKSFIILGELKKCGQTDMETCLNSVTVVSSSNALIFIDSTGSGYLNSIRLQLPVIAADFHIFRPSSFFIIVHLNIGLQLQIQLVPIMQLYILAEPSFRGKLCGLCGNYNNIQSDEFTGTNGMVEGTASAFANTWKAYPQCPDIGNIFGYPCIIHSENEQYAREGCDLLLSSNGSFVACHHMVNPEPYHKKCLFNTCACKENEDCLCAALSAYVRICTMKGVLLTGWRSNICRKYADECPDTLVYSYNVMSCQPSCHSLSDPDDTCDIPFVPVDGCVCQESNYLDNSGACVTLGNCPCYYQGSDVPPGGEINGNGIRW
ncbi:mucin-2-like [Ambystoma mexicanum]|uniref:mucin-2-like n=1 Tax=Ambystoma mexicanum TaxID=8296 RepID=UPI0037E8A06F